MSMINILISFLPLILIAAIVYGIVSWRNREYVPETDPGIGTVRRVYFYVVSFVTLMMAGNGIVQIFAYIVSSAFGRHVISGSDNQLALGLSLTVVGLPLWFLHWRLTEKYVREMPVEARTIARKLYAYLVLGVSGILLLVSSVTLLQWVFQPSNSFSGYHVGAIIIWGAVWAFFWLTERREGQTTPDSLGIRRFYVYVASLVSLSMAAYGLGRVVHLLLRSAYDAIFADTFVLPATGELWTTTMTEALAVGLIGAAVWGTHWLVFAHRDYGSTLRQVYLYVFAILGGVITALVSLGTILYTLIGAILQVAPDDTLVQQFRILPGAFTGLMVGIALGGYHFAIARGEASTSEEESQGAQRFYGYVMTVIGLGTSAIAAGMLTYTALALITETQRAVIAGSDVWRGPVTASITLIILGLPIWGYYWSKMQKRVAQYGGEERGSLSRRLFIFLVLGVGVLVLLGSVSTFLFMLLRDLLGTGLDASTGRDIRVPLSTIVGTLVFLPYYWRVYLEDRRAEPDEAAVPVERARRKQVSVLVTGDTGAFVNMLESSLGYRVTRLRWADADAAQPAMNETQVEALALRITGAGGNRVLVVPDGTGTRVLSYE